MPVVQPRRPCTIILSVKGMPFIFDTTDSIYTEGITTLEQLSKLPSLNANQRLGVKYFAEFEQKIPRNEVAQLWVCVVG
jgi:hypothetical protein